MRVLVLGVTGMLGHVVYRYLQNTNHEVLGVSRSSIEWINSVEIDAYLHVDELLEFLEKDQPEVVVNCIGVLVKESSNNPSKAIFLNSMLPHLLSDYCEHRNIKLIHISTDCVFDGTKGPYSEKDLPTETSWYGRTKALGEVINSRDLTLRTSIIGPDLDPDGVGLFNWFIHQKGNLDGYTGAFWNGITTLECAKQIGRILQENITLSGLYHLTTPEPISKYNLLRLIQKTFGPFNIKISPSDKVQQNKVLVNTRRDYEPQTPCYEKQLTELKQFVTTEGIYGERV